MTRCSGPDAEEECVTQAVGTGVVTAGARAAVAACLFAPIAAIALAMSIEGAAAQTYPVKPIRLIVPFAPGGPADVIGRIIGQQLNVVLGQSFVIENRGGAGGTIGAGYAAMAEPDGYTRPRRGVFARRAGRHNIEHSGDQSEIAGEDPRRADRLRQGQSRQARLCDARRRHPT
jgi:Tripartite tricarboxylate transporter family receptor